MTIRNFFLCFGELVPKINMKLYNLICSFMYDLLTAHWRLGLGVGLGVYLHALNQTNKKNYVFIPIKSNKFAFRTQLTKM